MATEGTLSSQESMLEELQTQNQLLREQNKLLQELLNHTPSKQMVDAGFKEQVQHLEVLSKAQRRAQIASWIKFFLIAFAIVYLFYLVSQLQSSFTDITNTISTYLDTFSSEIKDFQGSFSDIEETMTQMKEFFDQLGSFFRLG